MARPDQPATRMNRKELTLLVIAALLFAIWPVARTISLRELLLFGGAITAGSFYYHGRARYHGAWWRSLQLPLALIAALTLWMLIVALLVSPEPAWTLNELRGQWLKALTALAFGGLAAAVLALTSNTSSTLLLTLGAVLFAHVLAVDIDALVHHTEGHRAAGIAAGIDIANYLTNMLLALLLGELLARVLAGKRLLPLPAWALALATLLALASLYAERIRNGVGAVAVMLMCALALYLWHRLRRRPAGRWAAPAALVAVLVLAVSLLALAGAAKPGASWRQFLATVPVALDTETYHHWKSDTKYGLPTLADGSTVDASAYVRIAWFKQGLMLAGEHPLGVGFGRNAFGHAFTAKYGEAKGHSHSSFIDLLVGIGIPGMMLWLAFLASLLVLAARGFAVGWGYPLFFVVVDFSARMVVDSNVRDHMLQMFLFIVAALGVTLVRRRAPAARG